ncbi:hypothetical protein [Thalassococcus sp. S3]|uniref:hypothetical protein n=1 Tax=Thalassococcus sp. S3 TaxID=2017482 RepID=UPI0010248B6D|nr:hypothetical protein [Thalassococcus sp. S3]QBF31316.1 hypothetical protein CFI11_08805 [Thalassococcus sp. S3]
MRWIVLPLLVLGLGGCDLARDVFGGAEPAPEPLAAPGPTEAPDTLTGLGSGEQTADALDQTTPDEQRAAATPAAGGSALGMTVASLGNPAESGFWLKTPLVQQESAGRVEYNGQSVQVTLQPLGGPATAGSQMSLSAMRQIGAPLTDLVEVSVFTAG